MKMSFNICDAKLFLFLFGVFYGQVIIFTFKMWSFRKKKLGLSWRTKFVFLKRPRYCYNFNVFLSFFVCVIYVTFFPLTTSDNYLKLLPGWGGGPCRWRWTSSGRRWSLSHQTPPRCNPCGRWWLRPRSCRRCFSSYLKGNI